MCWQEELLRGELEPQGLFTHLVEGDLLDFQGWDAVCATLLLAGNAGAVAGGVWDGAAGHRGGSPAGGCACPCVLSPAALLNMETFSFLFLLHSDSFLLMLFLLLTCFNHSWSSNIDFWGELASLYHKKTQKTPKKFQEKHCSLEKQLSRGCARHRHLAQVGDEPDLPTEIEIQLPFKLFPVICADFPNQLQAILSPLQGVSKVQPGTLSCVIPYNEAVTEVASQQEGPQISQHQPGTFSVAV